MGRRDKERIAKIEAGEEPPKRHEKPEPIKMVRCKRCKVIFPESQIEEHFKTRCTGRQVASLPTSPGLGYE